VRLNVYTYIWQGLFLKRTLTLRKNIKHGFIFLKKKITFLGHFFYVEFDSFIKKTKRAKVIDILKKNGLFSPL
jgi:hypothetical protein